jgi:hypothetical protein
MYRASGRDVLDARKRRGRSRKVKGYMLAFLNRGVVEKGPQQY